MRKRRAGLPDGVEPLPAATKAGRLAQHRRTQAPHCTKVKMLTPITNQSIAYTTT